MDQSVVQQAKGGDREAFAVLVREISDSLFAVAFRILRDTERFEAWAHRILVHACYAESKRRRRFRSGGGVFSISGASADSSRAIADRDELERAFSKIPVDQRAVFVLHHYMGLSLVDVAETLGIPAGTARSRLHYATQALRTVMTAGALRTVEEGGVA